MSIGDFWEKFGPEDGRVVIILSMVILTGVFGLTGHSDLAMAVWTGGVVVGANYFFHAGKKE